MTAAVYAMPGRGVALPQQLVETERFTLQRAGTVEVVFSKGCQPVQFDIVTGATPDSIAPWSAWHGPLLFPMDTSSSLQHWGNGCGASTTTVPSTPSSEPPAPTSTAPVTVPPQNEPSTVPPEVLGSTTLQTDGGPGPEDPGTAATVRQPPVTEPDVLGSSSSVPGLPAGLALTGIAARALVLAAGVLLVLGVAMVVVGRVRARSDGF